MTHNPILLPLKITHPLKSNLVDFYSGSCPLLFIDKIVTSIKRESHGTRRQDPQEFPTKCPPLPAGQRGDPQRRHLLSSGDRRAAGLLRCADQIWRLQQGLPRARLPVQRQAAPSEVGKLRCTAIGYHELGHVFKNVI